LGGEFALEVLIILILVLINGLLSASEIALVSVRRTHLTQQAEEGEPDAEAALRLLRNPARFLATIQAGITLTGFFASAAGALSFVAVVSAALRTVPLEIVAQGADLLALVIVTIAISFVSILFGELVPKHLAIRYAQAITLAVARPIEWLAFALTPVVAVLTASSGLVLRLLGQGGAVSEQRPAVTEADLRIMFDVAVSEGDVEAREVQMLHRVFEFTDKLAAEVMTPRPEILFLEQESTLQDFFAAFSESAHARYPVCDGSPDRVVGVVYIKDVLKVLAAGAPPPAQPLTEFVRPAYFVPETKRVGTLFDEMRAEGNQMAIIVDEYGGTAGLLTLKQLIEEIVGSVGDDAQQGEAEYQTIDEHTFEVDGGMRIDDLREALAIELPEGEYETVAGFVLSETGHIPTPGEQLRYQDLRLTVVEMAGVKIETVRIARGGQ
jgi:putative hemolysin